MCDRQVFGGRMKTDVQKVRRGMGESRGFRSAESKSGGEVK